MIRSIAIAAFFLLAFAWVARADFTIHQIDRVEGERFTVFVFCDAPRGNIVYVAGPNEGFSRTPAIAVIHQSEVCK